MATADPSTVTEGAALILLKLNRLSDLKQRFIPKPALGTFEFEIFGCLLIFLGLFSSMFSKIVFTTIVFFASGVLARAPTHFQQWYPQYGASLHYRMSVNCTSQYNDYLNGSSTYCSQYSSQSGCLAGQVVDCILDNTSESTKANMAAAAVLLGILPTILSLAGSTTVEIGLLSQRRPLLALLLAAGSPAVSPLRSFEYRNIMEDLRHEKASQDHAPTTFGLRSMAISFLQYLAATGAIANLIHVSLQLCVSSLCSFAPDSNFLPALWILLAVPIHLVGAIALWIRVRLRDRVDWKKNLARGLNDEIKLSADRTQVELEYQSESYLFFTLAWFTSTGTVLHIVYGTLVFSSILFISTGDALIVVIRYLASTLVCRLALMFEIKGMMGRDIISGRSQNGDHQK